MKKDEFINLAPKCGYGNKIAAKRYVERHPKEDYDTDDFKALYEISMHWHGVKSDKGLTYAYGLNGKTTAYSNGIAGNSGARQDWGDVMNLNNYECDGQISIADFLTSNNPEQAEHILKSGQVVYKAYKGDIETHEVTGENWYIEHLRTFGNRTKVHGVYGVVLDSDIDNRVFFEKEKAEKIAEKYLQNHEVIRASEINPIETVAYSYESKVTGKRMVAFYSVSDNGMLYVKEFMTFEHLLLKEHVQKGIKKFMEQPDFEYDEPEKIEYVPKFKNMYRIKCEYDWDYAEARHSYAVG